MAEFLDWDAVALTAALRGGELSAAEVMQATLKRIGERNGVNAIVSLRDADALMEEARRADAREGARGPLHGLPMAVKDLADVKGMVNSQGSPLFADTVSQADSGFVRRMREDGAIFIGKTNVPEFGLGSHSYNPVHGVTQNPYDAGRTAGGSSGGAAAALACRMVALADGSDMMGSLRNPAAWCNVYGFRPGWGQVPREPGGESFMHQLSTIGPMARSPRDIALLLDTMAQPEPRVPFNPQPAARGLPETCSARGRRIAWLGDWGGAYPMEAGIVELCRSGLEVFSDLGAEIADLGAPLARETLWDSWVTLRHFSLAGELAPLFENPRERERLKPEAVWEVENGLALSALDVHRASLARSQWFARAAELFAEYDMFALPAAQVWPFPADWDWPSEIGGHAMDTYHRWMEVVIPASLIGLPAISLPVGFGEGGLPMGVQLIGARGSDRLVLEMAQAYHEATFWPQRHPPHMQNG